MSAIELASPPLEPTDHVPALKDLLLEQLPDSGPESTASRPSPSRQSSAGSPLASSPLHLSPIAKTLELPSPSPLARSRHRPGSYRRESQRRHSSTASRRPEIPALDLEPISKLDLTSKQATDYLQRISGYSLSSLLAEPERIADEHAFVTSSLSSLCLEEHGTFIAVSEASDSIAGALGEFEKCLDDLMAAAPELERECQAFLDRNASIQAERTEATRLQEHQDKLLDLLDLPTLVETCVRNAYYAEALELAAHVRDVLVPRYGHLPLIRAIEAQVAECMDAQACQLLENLRGHAKLPQLVKSINYLRRMGDAFFTEDELRIVFLESRETYFQSLLSMNGLDVGSRDGKRPAPSDPVRVTRKYVDLFRENVYDTVSQYTAIFLDPGSVSSAQASDSTKKPSVAHQLLLSFDLVKNVNPSAIDAMAETHPIEQAVQPLVRYAHQAVRSLLDVVDAHLPHIADTSSLSSLMTQLGYCALSFSRVGMDFTPLLKRPFEDAVLAFVHSGFDNANAKFRQTVEAASKAGLTPKMWICSPEALDGIVGAETSPPAFPESPSSTLPPQYLANYPPLAIYMNACLSTLNSLRLLAPLPLFDAVCAALHAKLAETIDVLVATARANLLSASDPAPGSSRRPSSMRRNTSISNKLELDERETARKRELTRLLVAFAAAFDHGVQMFLRRGLIEAVYDSQRGSVADVAVGEAFSSRLSELRRFIAEHGDQQPPEPESVVETRPAEQQSIVEEDAPAQNLQVNGSGLADAATPEEKEVNVVGRDVEAEDKQHAQTASVEPISSAPLSDTPLDSSSTQPSAQSDLAKQIADYAPLSREDRPMIVGPEEPQTPFPMRLEGIVEKGFGRGSKELGIPTANLPESASRPLTDLGLEGVFYGWAQLIPPVDTSVSPDSTPVSERLAHLSGRTAPYPQQEQATLGPDDFAVWPMAVSVGKVPFYNNDKLSMEVHIVHQFPASFYGHTLRVIVTGFIRPQYNYISKEALIDDINTDVNVGLKSLARPAYAALASDSFFVKATASKTGRTGEEASSEEAPTEKAPSQDSIGQANTSIESQQDAAPSASTEAHPPRAVEAEDPAFVSTMSALPSQTIVSAPGKCMAAGGYLVLDHEYTGSVIATSSRFYTTVKTVPASPNIARIRVRATQFFNAEWLYDVTLTDGAPAKVQAILDDTHTSANKFVELTLKKTLMLIQAFIGGHELQKIFGSNKVLEILSTADNAFYSQAAYLAERNLPADFDSMRAVPRFNHAGSGLDKVHKTGLGSSAALVTSLIAALLVHFGVVDQSILDGKPAESASEAPIFPAKLPLGETYALETVHNIAQYIHCLAQGKVGSGFDVSSAVFGSQRYRRFRKEVIEPLMNGEQTTLDEVQKALRSVLPSPQWTNEHLTLPLPPRIRLLLADVDAGTDTPSFVKKVLQWRSDNAEEASKLWNTLAEHNDRFGELMGLLAEDARSCPREYDEVVSQLCNGVSEPTQPDRQRIRGHFTELSDTMQHIRRGMKALGEGPGVPVEPDEQTRLLDACVQIKGVLGGGVPGAGGYDACHLLVLQDPSLTDPSAPSPVMKEVQQLWSTWKELRVSPLDCGADQGGLKWYGSVGDVEGLLEAIEASSAAHGIETPTEDRSAATSDAEAKAPPNGNGGGSSAGKNRKKRKGKKK